jgi:PAS domain S-box-containing protein
MDTRGRILRCNKQFLKLHKVKETAGHPKGRSIFDFCEPKEMDRIMQKFAEVSKKPPRVISRPLEIPMLKRGGTKFVGNIFYAVIKDDSGKPAGILGFAFDVTEQKKMENALRLTQTSIECASDNVYWINPDGSISYVNEAACESLGYTQKQLQRLTIPDIDPDCTEEQWKRYWRNVKKKKSILIESRHKRKDGSTFPVEVRANYIEFDGREYDFAFARDITDRKKTERQRQENLYFLESLERINRDIQSATDLEKMMTEVLDSVLEIFDCDRAWLLYPCDPDSPSWHVPMERTKPEYPGAMALGRDVKMRKKAADVMRIVLESKTPIRLGLESKLLMPLEASKQLQFQSQIAMALHPRLGQPWMFGLHQCSFPRVWKPGEERLFQAIGRRLEDALTTMLVLRDLRQSEERYRATFEQAIDSIVLVEPGTGRIEQFNDRACENLGYTRKEFEKLLLSDLEAVESKEEIRQHVDKIIEDGADIFETKHRTKNGEIKDVLVSAKVITIHGRKVNQAIFKDITERKKAEEKLREYHSKLKSMTMTSLLTGERERQRIAQGLHDDIGQKLAMAKLEILSAFGGDEKAMPGYASKLCGEVDDMIEKVRTLTFELSNPVLAELGLVAALERHLDRELFKKYGIEFELDNRARLGRMNEDLAICLFRSVRELLNNVVKHSNAKNVNVTIDKKAGRVVITVADDGLGFDISQIGRGISNGDMFGLFSIREQLESFSGRLDIESQVGRGSRFTISVPADSKITSYE